MNTLISFVRAAAAVSLMCGAVIAMPANAQADNHRLDEAWKAALQDFEGVMTDKEHALANSIAYHSAAARLCDGIDLDVDKVGQAMNALATAPNPEMTDDHRMERLANILLTVGTAKGIFLAEGSLQKEPFCKEAMEAKADTENEHFWK